MAERVIATLEQVTPAWLTCVLKASGALTAGAVAAFDVDAGHGNWSANAVLYPHYTARARGELSPRLFLKMVNTDLDDDSFGASEVTYYTRDYLGVAGAPLVRCYDAAYSARRQRYHLLLDDLSPTHVTASTKPPTLEYVWRWLRDWRHCTLTGGARRDWLRRPRPSTTPPSSGASSPAPNQV